MTCSSGGVLAAGTFGGSLGLYDREGSGSTIATFRLPGREADFGGQGVTSLAWSSCGNYLYVLQRKTKCILIYDFRSTGQMVGVFEGVAAGGNQRISMEVVESWGGKVVVGGDDGWVRMWDRLEGEKSVGRWEVGGGTVTGVGVHLSGGVVATAGGKRWFAPDDDNNEESEDEEKSEIENEHEEESAENCLKVWTLYD
jgi:telomerase Cajal body protein 1